MDGGFTEIAKARHNDRHIYIRKTNYTQSKCEIDLGLEDHFSYFRISPY